MIVLVEPEGKYLKSYHEAYLEYETNNINDYHFSDGDVFVRRAVVLIFECLA